MIINFILILMSVGAIIYARYFPEGDSANFPIWLAISILLLSIIDIIKSIFSKHKSTTDETEVFDNRSLISAVACIVYLIVMPYLGFVVSSGILCAIILKINKATSSLRAITYGLSLSVVIYLVFAVLMKVALPIGILN